MNFRSSATCPLRGSQSDLDSASACTKPCARFMTTDTQASRSASARIPSAALSVGPLADLSTW